jgi:uncharacterized membrane protein
VKAKTPQDLEGRLNEVLDDLRYVLIDQPMYKDDGLDTVFIKRDDKAIKKAKTALTHLIEAYTEDRVLKQLSRYMEQRCGCLNCDLIADDYAKLKLQGD